MWEWIVTCFSALNWQPVQSVPCLFPHESWDGKKMERLSNHDVCPMSLNTQTILFNIPYAVILFIKLTITPPAPSLVWPTGPHALRLHSHSKRQNRREQRNSRRKSDTFFLMAVVLFLFFVLQGLNNSLDLTFTLYENISSFKGNDP